MQKLSLDALARELVGQAAGGEKPGDSRVSRTVVGGHEKALRQTVIALAKDAALAEHASPGEATVLVLRGRVTLTAGAESWEGREGDLIIVPDAPHSLTAQADSAVLLTVVKRPLSAGVPSHSDPGARGRRLLGPAPPSIPASRDDLVSVSAYPAFSYRT
jgi:quercetin dioxygenase-like cupin family protein